MPNVSRYTFAGLLGLFLAGTANPARGDEFRGVWVDAWGNGFLNASQVTQLITDCRTYNFNAIVVQMRRRGDAFYAPGITGNDPKTTAIASGFDALADILSKAHSGSPRLEVHCWVTTFLVWSDSGSPPSQPGHVYNLHPEFLMKDSTGTKFISEGYYLDPGNPDATTWNYVMATNIVRRYDLDGFHWDYIRYPTTDSGYNDVAIARYNAEYGLTGPPASGNTQFANWRRRQVTDFLRWANADLLAIRPNLAVSCSVFGSRTDAYNARFQDWAAWNSEGIIDLCLPMGYTSDNSLFTSRVDDAYSHQGVRRVYSGQGAYLNTKENTVWQLDYIRNKPLSGSMLYSYRTPNSGTVDQAGTLIYIRDNHQPAWVATPAIPWKASPTKGIVRGTVSRQSNGTAVYNATVTLNTAPVRTQKAEAHGKFAFFETTPGTYSITATASDLGSFTTNVTLSAGGNVAVNLVLPPDTTPPIITDVTAANVTDTSATIGWTTDENANSAVDYGLSTAYGSVGTNSAVTVSHSVTLTNLSPNTTFHFRVRSRNAAGLQAASGDFSLTTNPAGVVNDVIVESRLAGGGLNANPPYTDSGFNDSTLKSSAAGLSGTGSRYATSGTPHYTIKPTLQIAGGTYDVYLTQGSASSISDDIIVTVSQTGATGLPASTTIFREPVGNTWESLGRMQLNSGITVPTLTFTYSSGTLGSTSRMYSDSIKFVYFPPPAPPVITNQPQSKAIKQGANATFSVGAGGATPLAYRWQFEGTNLAGATTSGYTVVNAQPANEGDYCVIITNSAGSITSAPAFLEVTLPPYIAAQPQSQTARQGTDATFFVTVGGSEPFRHQWRFNGTNLAGATDTSYTRASAQTNHAGLYSVVITNLAGAVTSSNATLTVTLPLSARFQSITLLPDLRARLVVTGEVGATYTLDGSSNLSGWFPLINALNTNGTLILIDDSASNAGVRFYRTRQ